MDRKYGHRGYRDAERQDKQGRDKSGRKDKPDRKPPQGGPRGATDHLGPRTPRMVGTVTRARCSNCGAVLVAGFDPKWKTVNVAATVPGLARFPAAQDWLDRQARKSTAQK